MLPLAYEGTNPRLGAIDTDQETALGPWERPRSRGFAAGAAYDATARCDCIRAKTHFSITMEPN